MIFQPQIVGKPLPALTNPGTAADLLSGKQLIDRDGNILTGSMESVSHPNPSISVSSSGLITASHTQDSGKVTGGITSTTRQLTTQAGRTITPGTSQQTAVASGRYTTGAVYVAGDSDLVASNIKSGVNIFGVTGTYKGVDVDDLHYSVTVTPASNGYYDFRIDSPQYYTHYSRIIIVMSPLENFTGGNYIDFYILFKESDGSYTLTAYSGVNSGVSRKVLTFTDNFDDDDYNRWKVITVQKPSNYAPEIYTGSLATYSGFLN